MASTLLPSASQRRTRLGAPLALLALALGAALAAGFLGRFSPVLDSFAHFRVHFAVTLAGTGAVLLLLRWWLAAGLAVAVAVVGFATTVPYLPSSGSGGAAAAAGPRYTLLQMNVLYRTEDVAEALRRIAETRPDVVALQEMTPAWRTAFERLADAYPHQFYCEHANGRLADAAILSRRPFAARDAGTCDVRNALTMRAVDFNGVPATIASHHQLWPWPGRQWERLDRARPTLRAIRDPAILSGDFNAAPWSASVAAYAQATGMTPAEGVGPTWFPKWVPAGIGRWIGLPIDNLLVSGSVSIIGVERLAATASDHLPVLVTFSVDPVSGRSPARRVDLAGAGD